VRASLKMQMQDEDGKVEPAPTGGGGGRPDPEIDKLSNIVKVFNDQFGNIEWKDADKIRQVIVEEIPQRVARDKAYQNAIQYSDPQNARLEHDKALGRVVLDLLADHTELFKQFSDNPSFKRWLADSVFDVTYQPNAGQMPTQKAQWRDRAKGFIAERFGKDSRWTRVADAIADFFATSPQQPMFYTDVEQTAAAIDVAIDEVITVLNILSTDDIALVKRTYCRVDEESGDFAEVSTSELKSGLSGINTPGILSHSADLLAKSTLVGWRYCEPKQ